MALMNRIFGTKPNSDQASRRLGARTAVGAILALVLAGCGVSSGSNPSSKDSNTSASGNKTSAARDIAKYIGHPDKALCDGKQYTFGYDAFSDTDAFAVALWQGLQRVSKDLGCVKINKLVDNADPSTAVQNARIFGQQHVDGAILFNVIQAASQGQAQVLHAANIPIVSLAVPAQGGVFVTNDDYADGVKAGTALGNAYAAKKSTGDVYAILGRFDAQTSTQQRMDGAIKGLKATVPGVKILPLETKADPPTAQAATTAVLPKVPSNATILISGVNDDVTYALFQGVKQTGRQDHAMVVSIGGANPAGLTFMCQNPQYVGAIGFFPENWPNYLIPALVGSIQGSTVPAKIIIPTKLITPDTISSFYPNFKCK